MIRTKPFQSDRRGMASLQAISILSVAAIIGAALFSMWQESISPGVEGNINQLLTDPGSSPEASPMTSESSGTESRNQAATASQTQFASRVAKSNVPAKTDALGSEDPNSTAPGGGTDEDPDGETGGDDDPDDDDGGGDDGPDDEDDEDEDETGDEEEEDEDDESEEEEDEERQVTSVTETATTTTPAFAGPGSSFGGQGPLGNSFGGGQFPGQGFSGFGNGPFQGSQFSPSPFGTNNDAGIRTNRAQQTTSDKDADTEEPRETKQTRIDAQGKAFFDGRLSEQELQINTEDTRMWTKFVLTHVTDEIGKDLTDAMTRESVWALSEAELSELTETANSDTELRFLRKAKNATETLRTLKERKYALTRLQETLETLTDENIDRDEEFLESNDGSTAMETLSKAANWLSEKTKPLVEPSLPQWEWVKQAVSTRCSDMAGNLVKDDEPY